MQSIAIEKVTLAQLEQSYGLQRVEDEAFFAEWGEPFPSLTTMEQDRLERVKRAYANLERRSVLENTVKLAIVAPLLDLAGFFLPPFYVETEKTVEIVAEDAGTVLQGRLDVLVLSGQLWVLVIESKRAEFSLKVGIPQVLGYMIAAPQPNRPLYGMVTNGSNFVFLKLMQHPQARYAQSKELILDQDQGIEQTLQMMKRLAERMAIA